MGSCLCLFSPTSITIFLVLHPLLRKSSTTARENNIMRQRRNLRGLISVTLFLGFVLNRSNSKSWDVRTFLSIVCNVINSTRDCLKAIAQNHATYPGTLSALRAPNLKWWSANRGQNKEKTAKTVQSGSRFTLFRLNCIKIVSVGTGFWRRDVNKKYKTTGDYGGPCRSSGFCRI